MGSHIDSDCLPQVARKWSDLLPVPFRRSYFQPARHDGQSLAKRQSRNQLFELLIELLQDSESPQAGEVRGVHTCSTITLRKASEQHSKDIKLRRTEVAGAKKTSNTMEEMSLASRVVWRIRLIISSVAIRSYVMQLRLLPLRSAIGTMCMPAIFAFCAFCVGAEPLSLPCSESSSSSNIVGAPGGAAAGAFREEGAAVDTAGEA